MRLWRSFARRMNPPVFLGSAAVVVGSLGYGAFFTESARRVFPAVQRFTVEHLGWLYVVTASAILVFMAWLGFSRFGSIRLGGDRARPRFGNLSWFSMLFSAGMGTGLVFWGVVEPISHFQSPPWGEPGTPEAVERALAISFFHWILWAVSEGAVAATLLYAGGLTALRTAALQSGLPMALILLATAVGLRRALRVDAARQGVPSRAALRG